MKLSDSDKNFINKTILNADEIINSDDEIHDFGRMAERVYDNIFYNN